MLCKYKNILGKPNEGLHKHVLGIAVVDVLATLVLAYAIYKLQPRKLGWNFWYILLSLFIIAILLHRLFCVNTTINKIIFGKI